MSRAAVLEPMTASNRDRAFAPAWAVLSFIGFVGALFGSFALLALVRVIVPTTHSVELIEWSVAWGALSFAGVLLAGRLVLGRWLRPSFVALATAVVGILLSAGVTVALQDWARLRYGMGWDPEYSGWLSGLFAVLLGVATAGFGLAVAPRGTRGWSAAALILGGLVVAGVLLDNVDALEGGISPEGLPLAVWLTLSGIYTAGLAAAGVVAWIRDR